MSTPRRGNPPPATLVRVVVKLAPAAAGVAVTRDVMETLRSTAPQTRFSPYFEEETLRAALRPPFDRYVATDRLTPEEAADLARRLAQLPGVEEAYVEAGPTPPPVNAVDDPRSASQGYLDAAPIGIDARWAWQHADGLGADFVDLERGWTLDHEDLRDAGISIISGLSQDFHGHGTAVLGEVVAVDNARGGVGIAPRARARVVSQWRTASNYNTAAAILSATQNMGAGDVLLLEAQTTVGGSGFLPVEVETAVFDAIRHAVDQGIVVVEAAGNGSIDLDGYTDAKNRRVLDRRSADFRDSGAIMVGAASSAVPHARLWFSNHGSRIDCFGWGENIDTTGDGGEGTGQATYTASFSGTSGASPIVTGAALLLQSWRRRVKGRSYEPSTLRELLSSPLTNTPSAAPAQDRIGVMPNLRAILERQMDDRRFRFDNDRYVEMVHILIGLINDGPGYIWVPGKKPVPVNPGWQQIDAAVVASQRKVLLALAVSELAAKAGDGELQAHYAGSAAAGLRQAAEELAGRLEAQGRR